MPMRISYIETAGGIKETERFEITDRVWEVLSWFLKQNHKLFWGEELKPWLSGSVDWK